MPIPLRLRVFLSSPSDVADERNLARRLLKEELPYRPLLRGRVEFEVVSWDDPAAPTPMLATLTPQEAVNRRDKPSACDLVVVVLWGRMGTPLPDGIRKRDGTSYLSGTEWEYEDAVNADPKPEVWVFRRMPGPLLYPDTPKFDEQVEQYRRVQRFFGRFTNPDGSIKGGYTTYDTPSAFKNLLADYCEALVDHRLKEAQAVAVPATGGTGAEQATPTWQGSPYPGLRAFIREEAAIFFGRGRETDALIARLRDPDQRFLAVVGASGTGKSSLVRAGLLPRLAAGAIEGSQHWRVLTFTPGAIYGDPFMALAVKLEPALPPGARKGEGAIATALATTPQRITDYAAMILAGRPAGAALVLVIDQLEELFTLVAAAHQAAFIDLLTHAAGDPRLRVLATLRADFLPKCTAEPKLAALLQRAMGIFPLGRPGPAALADMIRKPAERAGLDLEEGLIDEILKDAGSDPGALPLVAFCLIELYQKTAPKHRLTVDAYDSLGRLSGAMTRHTEALLEELQETEGVDLDAALPQIFRALIYIDAAGTATRRRAFWEELGETAQIRLILDRLVKGRLLTAESADGRATVTLAQDALLLEWPALRNWVDSHRIQLQRIQTLIAALGDANPGVRASAAAALGQIGLASIEVVPALITALGDDNTDVREGAAGALRQLGLAAMPALITALGDDNADVQESATEVLRQLGPVAVPALITALGDDDRKVRKRTAEALGKIGPATTEVVPALTVTLQDSANDVAEQAKDALRRIRRARKTTRGKPENLEALFKNWSLH